MPLPRYDVWALPLDPEPDPDLIAEPHIEATLAEDKRSAFEPDFAALEADLEASIDSMPDPCPVCHWPHDPAVHDQEWTTGPLSAVWS